MPWFAQNYLALSKDGKRRGLRPYSEMLSLDCGRVKGGHILVPIPTISDVIDVYHMPWVMCFPECGIYGFPLRLKYLGMQGKQMFWCTNGKMPHLVFP